MSDCGIIVSVKNIETFKMTPKRVIYIVIAVVGFISIWHFVAINSPRQRIPTPLSTLQMMINIFSQSDGWKQVWITAWRVFVGTALGAVIGFGGSLLTRFSHTAYVVVESLVKPLTQAVPSICWAFIGILWFGLSNTTPIFVVALSVTPILLSNMTEGLKNLDDNILEMAKMYTTDFWTLTRKIVIPMVMPFIFAGIKGAFIFAWKIVVLGEMFGSFSGMGYMISLSYDGYQLNRVFCWTFVFAIIINIFEYVVFRWLDHRYIRKWKYARA
ncbi:MAG: ABC transporter permease subunit [Dehalococcoidales bacterium]|nr:ABC transporter permease subunit [Dehalococcoidales bacterium]